MLIAFQSVAVENCKFRSRNQIQEAYCSFRVLTFLGDCHSCLYKVRSRSSNIKITGTAIKNYTLIITTILFNVCIIKIGICISHLTGNLIGFDFFECIIIGLI